jgi:hypothetical protein
MLSGLESLPDAGSWLALEAEPLGSGEEAEDAELAAGELEAGDDAESGVEVEGESLALEVLEALSESAGGGFLPAMCRSLLSP